MLRQIQVYHFQAAYAIVLTSRIGTLDHCILHRVMTTGCTLVEYIRNRVTDLIEPKIICNIDENSDESGNTFITLVTEDTI